MTSPPPHHDGDGDGEDTPPPRLMTRWFWLALIFALACILAGLAMATLGPRYL